MWHIDIYIFGNYPNLYDLYDELIDGAPAFGWELRIRFWMNAFDDFGLKRILSFIIFTPYCNAFIGFLLILYNLVLLRLFDMKILLRAA